MKIYANVKLRGKRESIIKRALVDTGAERSLMPLTIAKDIGAWKTDQKASLESVYEEIRTFPIIVAYLYFPSLNNKGGQFAFAMSDVGKEVIVGMDILNLLGVTIDTKTKQLSVKSEIWEAFKILAAAGILVFGGIKILEALSKTK